MKDVLVDTIIDSMKILPFLFITYLIMEYIEHKMTNKNKIIIQKAGKAGPAIGGLLGMVPQCGFSASASNLYVAKIISVGTLISVYLSTSDEMLPIFFSEHVPIISIIEILALKAFIGIIFGMIIDFVYHKIKHNDENIDIHSDICSHDHCHCESENLFLSSIKHTINILFFIFIFSLIMNTLFHYIGEDTIRSIIANKPVFFTYCMWNTWSYTKLCSISYYNPIILKKPNFIWSDDDWFIGWSRCWFIGTYQNE